MARTRPAVVTVMLGALLAALSSAQTTSNLNQQSAGVVVDTSTTSSVIAAAAVASSSQATTAASSTVAVTTSNVVAANGITSTPAAAEILTSSTTSTSTSTSSSSSSSPSAEAAAAATTTTTSTTTTPTTTMTTTDPTPTRTKTTTIEELMPYIVIKDPERARDIGAIISGCLLFLLMNLLFLAISLVIRYSGRLERGMMPKALPRRSLAPGGDGQFYAGLEPYSAQALVSSLSGTSIAASHASDVHLDAHSRSAAFHAVNRGFEPGEELHRRGAEEGAVGAGHFEESYKPIEMKTNKSTSDA